MEYHNVTTPGSITKFEIMPYSGYLFGGNVDTYYGSLDIKGNANYYIYALHGDFSAGLIFKIY